MLSATRLFLKSPLSVAVRRERKLNRRFNGGMPVRFNGERVVARQAELDYERASGFINPRAMQRMQRRHREKTLLGIEAAGHNDLRTLSTLGDDMPLNFERAMKDVTPAQVLANGDDVMSTVPPPVPYTPLAARHLAEGRWWPTVRGLESHRIKELNFVVPDEDRSPSSLRFCNEVEYHLARLTLANESTTRN